MTASWRKKLGLSTTGLAIFGALALGLSVPVSAQTMKPLPKQPVAPKVKVPVAPKVKVPMARPELKEKLGSIELKRRYSIQSAEQMLSKKPVVRIATKTTIPRNYRVHLIEWGGQNRLWNLSVQSWRERSIEARLPEELFSDVSALPARYEVALYDDAQKAMVANKLPLKPGPLHHAHVLSAKVYTPQFLAGQFIAHFEGVHLLPTNKRALAYKVVVPKMRGPGTIEYDGVLSANKAAAWDANEVKTGPIDYMAGRTRIRISDRNAYFERVRASGYVELAIVYPGSNRPLSKPVKIPAKRWILNEPPKVDHRVDQDGDGHFSIETGGDDCDDSDPNRYPGNTEVPDFFGNDEDCDPRTIGELDKDNDGYHDIRLSNANHYPYQTAVGRDCDDGNRSVHPGQVEVCNHIDDNCDGRVDEGVTLTAYRDADGDGFGDPKKTKLLCRQDLGRGWVENRTDCDDTKASVHPRNGNCP